MTVEDIMYSTDAKGLLCYYSGSLVPINIVSYTSVLFDNAFIIEIALPNTHSRLYTYCTSDIKSLSEFKHENHPCVTHDHLKQTLHKLSGDLGESYRLAFQLDLLNLRKTRT